MWNTMITYRRKCLQGDSIKDILNGEMYMDLRKPGNFLSSENNISLLFNTDGVPLYNSSKVGLWPVYLVINELPPVVRFSRQNMILWGVWQSKSKPAFQTYFQPFVQEMMKLKTQGFSLCIEREIINARAIFVSRDFRSTSKGHDFGNDPSQWRVCLHYLRRTRSCGPSRKRICKSFSI